MQPRGLQLSYLVVQGEELRVPPLHPEELARRGHLQLVDEVRPAGAVAASFPCLVVVVVALSAASFDVVIARDEHAQEHAFIGMLLLACADKDFKQSYQSRSPQQPQ